MPRGRPKKVVQPIDPDAPIIKNKQTMFGWCGTGHHSLCIKVLPSYPDIKCGCKCHGEE